MQERAAVDVSKWEMGYGDMVLKKQIGSGQEGIVLLAYLKREAVSPMVTDYIRKQSAPGGRPNYLLVAVKRFRGETLATRGLLLLWLVWVDAWLCSYVMVCIIPLHQPHIFSFHQLRGCN